MCESLYCTNHWRYPVKQKTFNYLSRFILRHSSNRKHNDESSASDVSTTIGAGMRANLTKRVFRFVLQQLKDELCEVVNEMEGLDCGEDGKKGNKTKMMSIGRKKFNMDPKKGIEYLIENGLLQQTAESVAQFLYKGEGLNKTAIGDYLGEKNDFNEKVLQAFVALHDFADLILVQALRYIYLHKKQNNLFLVVELLFILILRVYRVKF